MNFLKGNVRIFFLILCGMVVLTGCQTIRDSNAKSKEEMLAAAGFQMKEAQTPEQLANVRNMPQRKLLSHTKDGQVMYVFADAEVCQCVYVGTEKSYQDYQKMVYQTNLADEQETTAAMNNDSMFEWESWGTWGPWGH